MTLYQKSGIVTAGVISAFFIIAAFNLGRLTTSRVHIGECQMSYNIPFKGTLP